MKKHSLPIMLLITILLLSSCGQAPLAEPKASDMPEVSQTVETQQLTEDPMEQAPFAEETAEPESTAFIEPPVLTAVSTIFGSADTGGKSTLKRTLLKTSGPGDQTIYYTDEAGNRVAYEEGVEIAQPPVTYTGGAVLTLQGDGLDDRLIDSSNAVVRLVEGCGYYPEELHLSADKLNGEWENGTFHYTLEPGALEWNTGDYPMRDPNSGREWSVFGGDGNGCYTFRFEVSGITYAGQLVDSVVFPVRVYIWGRSAGDLKPSYAPLEAVAGESGVSPNQDIQWTWIGDGEKPILCDALTDDFYVTWADDTDASEITINDVTVTMTNSIGDVYELRPDEQFAVFPGKHETQIAVIIQYPALAPVFSELTIDIDHSDLQASSTWEIASAYTSMVQQGGGGVTVDRTVTAYSFYGYEGLEDVSQVSGGATYTLTATVDGETVYYAEDETGRGYLTTMDTDASIGWFGPTAPEDAVVYDATGIYDCNVQLIGNTLYVTTRLNQTEVKTVDGQDILFSKSYNTSSVSRGSMEGITAAPGYLIYEGGINRNNMWAWSDYFHAGWEPSSGRPTDFPYGEFPFGR